MEQTHPPRRWADVLKHRWPTVLGIAVAALTVFDLRGGTELAALTMLMPVVYLGAAALDRRRFAWVVLLAGVTVLVALYVDPDLGGYLVAFALIGHAGWDAFHYLRNRVVARSYAEFCAVLDLLAGAAILMLLA